MISMTGYGMHEYQDESLILTAEIKSYNNRYLDINMNLPGVLNPLEEKLRTRVKAAARRGKIDVYIRFRRLQQEAAVRLDTGLLDGYLKAFREAQEFVIDRNENISIGLTPHDLLQVEGLLTVEQPRDIDQLPEYLDTVMDAALTQWNQSRAREGNATKENIQQQLARISEAFAVVSARAPEMEQRIKDTLHERFTEMMGEQIDLQRVYAEIAVLLVKYSINEELARLGAHIEEFHRLLDSPEAMGKRMDFLCQEIHREMNTIGSKSALLEVSRSVIDMKDSLENIREQVRNIE
ncbi:MAG: YicC/YloC family endoribonuclease [Spirochaeta sp.]